MDIGIKERLRYRDISWMMQGVDIGAALQKLGTEEHGRSGDRVMAFCPDHQQFTGRTPSHPRWLLNTTTGDTFCLTEGRGSNLVWTFCRVHKCSPSEAAKMLLGQESENVTSTRIAQMALSGKFRKLREQGAKPIPKSVLGLDDISKDLENRYVSERLYQFFVLPPGKIYPTNIQRETVDRYQVFERTWGRYADRAVVPVFMRRELTGFVAIDLLGKDEWMKKHPLSDDYRKTLTAINMVVGETLFGFDDCERNADYLIIVEGPREVMKLWQEGFPNAVATFGVNVCPGHMVLISELAPKRILLMYDRDLSGAGVAAMDKQAKKLVRNHKVGKCFCPVGRDPKNLDRRELQTIIDHALTTGNR